MLCEYSEYRMKKKCFYTTRSTHSKKFNVEILKNYNKKEYKISIFNPNSICQPMKSDTWECYRLRFIFMVMQITRHINNLIDYLSRV